MGYPPQGGTPISVTRATYIDMIPGVEHETEWSTDPVVENVAAAALTTLTTHTIPAADFVYPTGSTAVRVILLPMISAAAQEAPLVAAHHVGITIQGQINDGGWADITVLTVIPPMGLAVDGAMGAWAAPIDIAALVSSGDELDFRFQVQSSDAGSVNYTTSFVVMLVYRM